MRDLLVQQAVVASLDGATKKDAVLAVAELAATQLGFETHTIFNVLWEREKLGTTGVGAGLAIPHGRLENLSRVHGFFARLAQPIGFESIDNKPVDLIFLLLAPESAGADHLNALATVSRLLRSADLCKDLRAAPDAAALYSLLTETVPAA